MDKYTGKDFYCYDGTDVLINKFNLIDAVQLEEKERKISMLNTIEIYNSIRLNQIKLDLKFYKKIHKVLFNDIYNFAGKFRNIVLIKGNTRFCEPMYIENSLKALFKQLNADKYLQNLVINDFVERIAYYYSELNAIHPFREGNGRTNRIFIDILAKSNNYNLHIEKWNEKEQVEAMIESINGKDKKLVALISKHITNS